MAGRVVWRRPPLASQRWGGGRMMGRLRPCSASRLPHRLVCPAPTRCCSGMLSTPARRPERRRQTCGRTSGTSRAAGILHWAHLPLCSSSLSLGAATFYFSDLQCTGVAPCPAAVQSAGRARARSRVLRSMAVEAAAGPGTPEQAPGACSLPDLVHPTLRRPPNPKNRPASGTDLRPCWSKCLWGSEPSGLQSVARSSPMRAAAELGSQ